MAPSYPSLVGDPCQVAVPVLDRRRHLTEHDRLCGEPSFFIYKGPPPKRASERRTTLLMCPDHAKAMAQDCFAWTIHDSDTNRARPITIERLDMIVHRFHCKACGAFTKVVWDTDAPQSNPGDLSWCPRCGARSNSMLDPEADYWDVMSMSFDGMAVELLRMLYSEWDRIRYPRFRDYVQAEIDSFDTTGDFIDATTEEG